MIFHSLLLIILGFLGSLNLSGCSIAMALHGAPEPDFNHIKIGSTREQIDFEFNQPGEEKTVENGKIEVTDKYEMGNGSNPARATIYGLYDLLYIGIPEPIFTLIELFQGHDEETRVVYGSNKVALDIQGYTPPPPSEAMKAAQAEQDKFVRKRPEAPAATSSETPVLQPLEGSTPP